MRPDAAERGDDAALAGLRWPGLPARAIPALSRESMATLTCFSCTLEFFCHRSTYIMVKIFMIKSAFADI